MMPDSPKKRSPWIIVLPLLYMGAILLFSSLSGLPNASAGALQRLFSAVPSDVQNVLHIPVYAGLACLWYWVAASWAIKKPYLILVPVILAFIYGLLNEWYQVGVPGRFSSLADIVLNTIGIVLGIWLYERWQSWREIQIKAS